MALMALMGFATARWVLRIKRLRGQLVAALMVGLLDVHLFTLLR
jgi:lipopolysaccharide export LptBFGC system permease protein LptF